MANLRSISAALLVLCTVPAQAQLLRIYYPDIEQGSSTLVVSPTGQALLIDASTGIKSTEDGIEDFVNDLIAAGIVTSLDFTLATHYDEDHIGRMEDGLQVGDLDVYTVNHHGSRTSSNQTSCPPFKPKSPSTKLRLQRLRPPQHR